MHSANNAAFSIMHEHPNNRKEPYADTDDGKASECETCLTGGYPHGIMKFSRIGYFGVIRYVFFYWFP